MASSKTRVGGKRSAPPRPGNDSEERAPALRRPKPKEELAKLHPVERALYRVFEFFASLKLAIFLMAWLMVECIIGTFVEAQVNTAAAKYFIYSHWRFSILLALLALNILSAALIRFPWKRYQTGFVITHAGLLTILAGSMITALTNLDTLMSVPEGKTEHKIIDPGAERIIVSYRDASGKMTRRTIPVEFGPFTWGHRIFGLVPWAKDYVEEHDLENGDTLRIKRFFANCQPERVYAETEEGGIPAVQFRLYHPERFDITDWLATDGEGGGGTGAGTGRRDLGPGSLVLWRVDTDEELEHFLHATPQGDPPGPLGTLGYSRGGQHYRFGVDELKKGPIQVPGTDIELTLVEYLANARPGKDGKLVSEGNESLNPALRIRVKQGDKETEFLTFGKLPEFSPILTRRFGREHLFTYFPVDMPAVVHLAMTPQGRLGYRAFGSQGVIAVEEAVEGKEYPSWAGMTFVPKKVIGSARPDLVLRPLGLPRGQAGNPGVIVEVESGKDTFRTALGRGMSNGRRLGDRLVTVKYDIEETEVPFEIRLDSFEEPTNPGTNQAAMYTSYVTMTDRKTGAETKAKVTMNAPLHYTDADGRNYTLYQSGIDRSTGTPISTFTVADDPGLKTKYAGSIMLCTGVVMMFYMGGYFRKGPRRAKPAGREAAATEVEEAELIFSE